jgi:hypothetical protein
MNPLLAVFWDYPALATDDALRTLLCEGSPSQRGWALARFLERGRVRETIAYFTRADILRGLSELPPDSATRRKWERLLEVYPASAGR